MSVPTFNGEAIFQSYGTVSIQVRYNPRAEQVSGFFGVQGVERKDGGSRGAVALVSGTLRGDSEASLALAEAVWFSYIDGIGYTLVDTIGRSWPSMKLTRFEPTGLVRLVAGSGLRTRDYRAEFSAPY